MNRLKHSPFFAVVLLTASFTMLFISCRASRQETRRPTSPASSQSGSPAALKHQVDSLLVIEEKLLEVIDSMTGLVNADHSRIRELERQVHEMRMAGDASHTNGTPLPPPASPYDSPPGSDPPHTPIPGSVTSPRTMQERYSTALRMFNENDFESAMTEFQSLERDDANGAYASNYKYWEGECYYGEKRYNMALQTFGMMLEQYPKSPKAAAAQFKTGECYEKLNIPSSARAAYERVISDYPSSEYVDRAQSRLNALRK